MYLSKLYLFAMPVTFSDFTIINRRKVVSIPLYGYIDEMDAQLDVETIMAHEYLPPEQDNSLTIDTPESGRSCSRLKGYRYHGVPTTRSTVSLDFERTEVE